MAPGRKRGANKSIAKGELRLGDLVLAKVKGFPAWPAKIGRPEDWDQVPDPKKCFVQFFGTQEIAFVTPPDIQAFTNEAKNKLLNRCQGKTVKYFAQAVEEISAAFEESQNHKSDVLGSEPRLNALEPSLSNPKILDGIDNRVASNDGSSDKFDSRADPCLHILAENNGAESKSDIGEQDSSSFLKSNNRTTSPSIGPLEHGSAHLFLEVADFDDKIDGVTCTEHRDPAGNNPVNGQRIIKKIAGDSDKRCKDEVQKAKRVSDSRAARDNHLLGPNQKLKGSKVGQDHGSKKETFENKVVSDLTIASSKKSKELLKEKPSAEDCGDKHEYAIGSKSGILGKKKRIESELGKSASGADESIRAAKRPRLEDVKDQKQSKSKRPLPVGEGKAQESDSTGVTSILKHEIVLGLSARGGKFQFDKEVVAYTKRRKQTVEHTSVSSFSGSRHMEEKNHPKLKISSSSAGNVKVPAGQPQKKRRVYINDKDDDEDPKTPVHGGDTNVPKATSSSAGDAKVPTAQLPKRRRAVCIYDEEDDEDPKTPVHGGHTIAPKATSASTDGPKSANASHGTSIKAKRLAGSAERGETRKVPLYKHDKDIKPILKSPKKSPQSVSFKKQVTGQNKTAKFSGAGMPDNVDALSNSSSMGKPVIKLPPKNVKQVLRSPKKSPQLVSTKDQVAGQNKIAEVSGAGMPKKCQGDSSKDTLARSDRVVSSQSQIANQRSKPAFGEKPTGIPKVASRVSDARVSSHTSANLPSSMTDVNQENGIAPVISSGVQDAASSMKDLIAAAQAKRKQAHSHLSPFVNLDDNSISTGEMQTKSHSPSMVQNVSSSDGEAMLIVAQGHQEGLIPSNHGHPSSPSNQAETEENEERRISSGHRSVDGSLSGATEAAISRDAFEGMIETLSRTKESIGRATRQAINCAKYGIASEVVELLIRKLENEPHFCRKVDLFFLVDSITQCSHSHKGKAGALYIPTVQAALPRLLHAAAPPGTGARENRHQCRKVMRLWLERKIFPDSLLRRYIGDIGASGDDATIGFCLRRPSRSERAVDDPLREMEGMLVDEYGSNASFQLPGFLYSHAFGDDEEDDDLPSTSQEVKNTHIEEPVHALGKLEALDSSSNIPHCVLKDVDGVLEKEDGSCQPREEVPLYVCGIEAKEDSPAATTATELSPLTEGSPPLPHESPPSPPPLPPSPPPPPSSLAQLPPPPPPSEQCRPPPPSEQCPPPLPAPLAPPPPQSSSSQSIVLPPSSITQPSMPSHPSLPLQPVFPPPAYPLLQHEYHSSIAPVTQPSMPGHPSWPNNTSFLQRPMIRNLAPAPSSHFPLPGRIVQSQPQPPSFPLPYPFPSQPVDGRQHMNEEPWRMPSNGRNGDAQNGAWISGRNPLPGSTVTDGFFRLPPERPPSQMLPSRPDVPSGDRWRPS